MPTLSLKHVQIDGAHKEIVDDPTIDITTLTRKQLQDMGVDPDVIDQIMELKKIWDELNEGKPMDCAKLKKRIDGVVKGLKKGN